MLKLLFLALVVFGVYDSVPFHHIDNEIVPYYNKFREILEKECGNLHVPKENIILGKLEDNDIGLCKVSFTGNFEIVLDEGFFNRATDTLKEALISHEGLHCYLHVNHNEQDLSNLMYPFIPLGITIDEVHSQETAIMRKICQKKN